MIESTNGCPSLPELADVKAQQDSVHHGDAENRNKSDRGRNAERGAGDEQPRTPPRHATGICAMMMNVSMSEVVAP